MPTLDSHPHTAAPFVFSFGPFRFTSDLDVPELRRAAESAPPPSHPGIPVRILLGGIPGTLEGAVDYGEFCRLSRTEYMLHIPDVARYYVRNGEEVRVEIAPGTPIANVSTYLLGSVFGVLCHQNGLLPLHASAIQQQDSVIAFLGDSGAGKSTLAACLQARGHRIVSDDICLLQPHDGSMHVIPVAGWLKLWNQSLAHLGQTPEEQNRVFSTDDKFRLYLEAPATDAGPLAHTVFLARAPDPSDQPALEPLPIPDAIGALMETVYVAYVPALTGQQTRVFRDCASVFARARAWRLTVPWDLARIDAVLDLLERDILSR